MPPSLTDAKSPARILQLDAVRGLAALSVVLFHYTTGYAMSFGRPEGLVGEFFYGDHGVQLFFMLSGFVIFMTLARTSTPMDFIAGRFARLFPAYWAAVAVTFAVVSLAHLPGKQVTGIEALVNLTMIQQLLGARHVDGAYWSLQVELMFYVMMVVLFRLGAPRRPWTMLLVWVTAGLCVHGGLDLAGQQPSLAASMLRKLQTLLCLEYVHLFAIGITFYQVYRNRRWTWPAVAMIGYCVIVQAVADSWIGTALIVGFIVAFHLIVAGRMTWLTARPLVWLGSISYPLYLLHQNLGYVMIRQLNGWGVDPNLSVATACLLAIGLASVFSRLVERPAMASIKAIYKTTRRGYRPAVAGQLR